MQLVITARHMELTEALKDYMRNKIERLNKYTDEIIEANAILSVEKYRHSAEITVKVNGTTLSSVDITENMYSSIDRVIDKMERQLKKFKEKRKEHKHKKEIKAQTDIFSPDTSETLIEETRHIKSKKVALKHMDLKEALESINISDDKCIIFINARNNQINVLYKNSDEKFILIEPED